MAQTVLESLNLALMGKRAKAAAAVLARKTSADKNAALLAIADALEANTLSILEANQRDLEQAARNGVDPIWIRDRINLESRMAGIIADVRKVAELPDPVGEVLQDKTLDNGLQLVKRRTPLGVLGDDIRIAAERDGGCFDAGAEDEQCRHFARRLGCALQQHEADRSDASVLAAHDFPAEAIQYISSTDRRYVREMLRLHEYIDMIIPRGGNGLHTFCRENSSIPVITGGIGVCHIYVDDSAQLDKVLPVLDNAKTQRPAVCNSMETLLVHRSIAAELLPQVVEDLGAAGVEFHAGASAPIRLSAMDERVCAGGRRKTSTPSGTT